MFKLTTRKQSAKRVVDYVSTEGKEYQFEIDYSFDNILRCFEVQQEPLFNDYDKLFTMYCLLVPSYKKYKDELNVFDIALIVKKAFELLKIKDNAADIEKIELLNFNEDAERIYSSFLMDYNIDLTEVQGEMSWAKFMALFNNLSEKTPIMKALYYRTCDLPSGKSTDDERKRVKKMKEFYELESQRKAREMEVVNRMEQQRKRLAKLHKEGRI